MNCRQVGCSSTPVHLAAQVRDAVATRGAPRQWSRPTPVCFRGMPCCFLRGALLQAIVRAATSACQGRTTLGRTNFPTPAACFTHHRKTPFPPSLDTEQPKSHGATRSQSPPGSMPHPGAANDVSSFALLTLGSLNAAAYVVGSVAMRSLPTTGPAPVHLTPK